MIESEVTIVQQVAVEKILDVNTRCITDISKNSQKHRIQISVH